MAIRELEKVIPNFDELTARLVQIDRRRIAREDVHATTIRTDAVRCGGVSTSLNSRVAGLTVRLQAFRVPLPERDSMCRVDDDARRALDVWLQAVEGRDEDAGLFSFPTDAVRDAYFDSIASRSEEDVRDLLRHFLMKTGSLGADELRLESLKHLRAKRPDAYVRQAESTEGGLVGSHRIR